MTGLFKFKTYDIINDDAVIDIKKTFSEKLTQENNFAALMGRKAKTMQYLSSGTYGTIFTFDHASGTGERTYVMKFSFFDKDIDHKQLNSSSNCEAILQQLIFNIFSIHDKPHAIKMQYTFISNTNEILDFMKENNIDAYRQFKRFNIRRQKKAQIFIKDLMLMAYDMDYATFIDAQFEEIRNDNKKMRILYYLLCYYYKHVLKGEITIEDYKEEDEFKGNNIIFKAFESSYENIRKLLLQESKSNDEEDIMRHEDAVTIQKILYSFFSRVNNTCRVTIAQKAESDLLKYIMKNHNIMTPLEWKSLLFQAVYVIYTIQHFFPQFRHNDYKANNVLIIKVPSGDKRPLTSESRGYRYYKIGDDVKKKFKVPCYGYSTIIWDFDFASIGGVIDNHKLDALWVKKFNMTKQMNRYYDVYMFFSFLSDVITKEKINVDSLTLEFMQKVINPTGNSTEVSLDNVDRIDYSQVGKQMKNKTLYHTNNRVLNPCEFLLPQQILESSYFDELHVEE